MNETSVYTVSQLTQDIRFVLEDTFSDVWVEGEVSNFKVYSSGHMYFSLKDDKSLINCVLFKGNSRNLAFDPEDGMAVLCFGKVSVYDKRGQYQLYVSAVEPRGRGALQRAFEQLKDKLRKEGLFEESIKKPLPFLPLNVGVVTSPSGAAIRDILKVARRRNANIDITICPVRVQGEEAKNEIAGAIKIFNEFNRRIIEENKNEHSIDVIIVGRGGGSLEDLWPFNEEIVARAIHNSKIPIVSAVGHEVDYTISDFVSDLRAPTPSAAAELVIPSKKELEHTVDEYKAKLISFTGIKLKTLEKEIEQLSSSYVLRDPVNVFVQKEQEIDDFEKNLSIQMNHVLKLKLAAFGAIAGKLNALSPLSVLERGYSIAYKGKNIAVSAKSFKKGELLRTKFIDGVVDSKVVNG
ncbi:MAG: exodeoxyribonuclease VII large subunit [Candidatus Omnitrophota bacterium]